MILNEATVKSNHRRWPLFNFRKGQFMLPRFLLHGHQPAVDTPVQGAAETDTEALYFCKFHRKLANRYEGILIPHRSTQKTNKTRLVP